jgi:hypothetical protein
LGTLQGEEVAMSTMAQSWARTFERVESQARTLTPQRVLLTLVAAPLFLLGWLAARVCALVWLVFAWSLTAVQLGWHDAGGLSARRRPRGDLGA